MINIDELKQTIGIPLTKEKKYVDNPANAPTGANIQRGPRGGYYYETTEADDKPTSNERVMFNPTAKQESKWSAFVAPEMPSDDEFKRMWKKKHGGKDKGWGLEKLKWVNSNLGSTKEYQMGLWQGRVDAANGLDYSEERGDKTQNYGYYRGFTNYKSDIRGWDANTLQIFKDKYIQN